MSGEIYHDKFHRRSYLDIQCVFCEVSGFKPAPVWGVTQRQSLQIASLWRNEAVGRAGVKASARETSSQRSCHRRAHIDLPLHLIFAPLD